MHGVVLRPSAHLHYLVMWRRRLSPTCCGLADKQAPSQFQRCNLPSRHRSQTSGTVIMHQTSLHQLAATWWGLAFGWSRSRVIFSSVCRLVMQLIRSHLSTSTDQWSSRLTAAKNMHSQCSQHRSRWSVCFAGPKPGQTTFCWEDPPSCHPGTKGSPLDNCSSLATQGLSNFLLATFFFIPFVFDADNLTGACINRGETHRPSDQKNAYITHNSNLPQTPPDLVCVADFGSHLLRT